MSRAFVKESDGAELDQPLPELVVSPHRNLVTSAGHARIEAEIQRLQAGITAARAAADRAQLGRLERDLRYWSRRRATAEVVADPVDFGTVRFGTRVVLAGDDGSELDFRIVGEDEAAPAEGRISYVSPLAQQLLGSTVGDTVASGGRPLEIMAIR